ncbi:MAG TPA: hypothetical protein VN793_07845 [Acidimicrobiales bacterium]|nr:hypothetical protein [Acidimicrobiales bacterium]
MAENEHDPESDSEETPRRQISRRAFLASGAALGGVVVWGAAGAPSASGAGAPPIMGGPPPILDTAPPYPPIIGATGGPPATGPGPTGGQATTQTGVPGPSPTAGPGPGGSRLNTGSSNDISFFKFRFNNGPF